MREIIESTLHCFSRRSHVYHDCCECLNTKIRLDLSEHDFDEAELKDFYSVAGIDYDKKLDTEIDHYEKLSAAMKHEIHKNKFFFNQGAESRKNIVLNDDCISLIQYMQRYDTLHVNVYVRSTDIISLFFMDMYNMKKMVDSLIERHDLKVEKAILTVFVANMHYYLKDKDKFKKIVNYYECD